MSSRRLFRVAGLCALLVFGVPASALAQQLPAVPSLAGLTSTCAALTILAPEPVATPVAPVAAQASAPPAAAVVLPVTPLVFRSPQPLVQEGTTARWNSEIKITFKPIDARLAKCLESELTLFLDHHPLTGVVAVERMGDRGGMAAITYRLTRPTASSPGWNELMAKAWQAGGARDVTVGVGVGNNEFGYSGNTLTLTLGRGSASWAWWALAISAVLLAAVWRFSKVLQDRQTGEMTYSVSRLLLGCWVLTTICAVLLMVIRTGTVPSASEGGLVFMLAISGASTGLSALIDLIRKPRTLGQTRFWQDFLNDADGLALHRLQVVLFNFLVLFVVWRDMIELGTVAQIDKGWAALLGASALTFVFGKSGESTTPLMPSTVTGLDVAAQAAQAKLAAQEARAKQAEQARLAEQAAQALRR